MSLPDTEERDINDVFDAISFSEEKILKTGFEEGLEKGTADGAREGFVLGLAKGSELGTEVGFYQGFAEGWIAELRSDDSQKKSEKAIIQLEKLALSASEEINNSYFAWKNFFDIYFSTRVLKKLC